MKKILFFIAILIIIIAGVIFLINIPKKSINQPGAKKIKIVTTLFPLYDFAKIIGGDKVEVTLLLPPGVDAHTFEPKPSDIVEISNADIFIYTGKSMEPWVADMLKSLTNKNVTIIDASIGIKMESAVFHNDNGINNVIDPHIWLDFNNDKIITKSIADVLINKDSANSNYYSQNSLDYQNKLTLIDAEYASSLSKCQTNEIVYGGHYAFGYLVNRYGLKYLAVQGVSPDAEPSAQDLTKTVDQIRKDGITYIFYEELSSPKIAQTLADETNAKLLLLNAAHNITKDDFEKNVSFLDIMEENLINLKVGLNCN